MTGGSCGLKLYFKLLGPICMGEKTEKKFASNFRQEVGWYKNIMKGWSDGRRREKIPLHTNQVEREKKILVFYTFTRRWQFDNGIYILLLHARLL